MRNLKAWQKLALMGAISLLPFAVVTYKMASSINTLGVEFAEQELRGLEYYTPLTTLLKNLQLHRSLTALALSGDTGSRASLDSTRASVETDIKRVDEVDQRLDGALQTTAKWTPLRKAIRDLLDAPRGASAEDSSTQHSNVIVPLIALIAHVGDASNLTRDPDLDKKHLIEVLISQGPELSEALDNARGFGITAAAARSRTADQAKRLDRDTVVVEILAGKMDQTMTAGVSIERSPQGVARDGLPTRRRHGARSDGRAWARWRNQEPRSVLQITSPRSRRVWTPSSKWKQTSRSLCIRF